MQFKRGAIQLAALVDLLFVIVFLQFTELEISTNQEGKVDKNKIEELDDQLGNEKKSLKNVIAQRDEGRAKIKGIEVTLREIKELLKKAEDKVDTLEKKDAENSKKNDLLKKDNDTLKEAEQRAKERKEKAEKETQNVYKAVKDFIGSIDPKAIEEAMKQDEKQDREKIIKALGDLAGKKASQVALELKKASEIRNRIDVFEVHIFDDDQIRLRRSDAPPKTFTATKSKEFSDTFELYVKSGNQPKNMVLILFTTGDCKYLVMEEVKKGIDEAIVKLKALNTGADIQSTIPSFLSIPPD